MKIPVFTACILIFAFKFAIAENTVVNDFTLEDTEGNLFVLSENLGEGPLLIVFWATWCNPCKQELSHIQDLYEKYDSKGLQVVAISVDSPRTMIKVKPYVLSKEFTFTILLDPNSEVLKQFQSNSVPFSLLLDARGNIIQTHRGYNPGDEKKLESEIEALLKAD